MEPKSTEIPLVDLLTDETIIKYSNLQREASLRAETLTTDVPNSSIHPTSQEPFKMKEYVVSVCDTDALRAIVINVYRYRRLVLRNPVTTDEFLELIASESQKDGFTRIDNLDVLFPDSKWTLQGAEVVFFDNKSHNFELDTILYGKRNSRNIMVMVEQLQIDTISRPYFLVIEDTNFNIKFILSHDDIPSTKYNNTLNSMMDTQKAIRPRMDMLSVLNHIEVLKKQLSLLLDQKTDANTKGEAIILVAHTEQSESFLNSVSGLKDQFIFHYYKRAKNPYLKHSKKEAKRAKETKKCIVLPDVEGTAASQSNAIQSLPSPCVDHMESKARKTEVDQPKMKGRELKYNITEIETHEPQATSQHEYSLQPVASTSTKTPRAIQSFMEEKELALDVNDMSSFDDEEDLYEISADSDSEIEPGRIVRTIRYKKKSDFPPLHREELYVDYEWWYSDDESSRTSTHPVGNNSNSNTITTHKSSSLSTAQTKTQERRGYATETSEDGSHWSLYYVEPEVTIS